MRLDYRGKGWPTDERRASFHNSKRPALATRKPIPVRGYIDELPYKELPVQLRALTLVLMADICRSIETAGLEIAQAQKRRRWRFERCEADEGFVADP